MMVKGKSTLITKYDYYYKMWVMSGFDFEKDFCIMSLFVNHVSPNLSSTYLQNVDYCIWRK